MVFQRSSIYHGWMTEPVNRATTGGDHDSPARRSLDDRWPSPPSCDDHGGLSKGRAESMPNGTFRSSNIRWSMPCDSDVDNGRGRHNSSARESDAGASKDARLLARVTSTQSGADSTDSDDTMHHIRSVLGFSNHTVTYDCPVQGARRYSTAISHPNRICSGTDHQRFPPATMLEKHRQCRPRNKRITDNKLGHELVSGGNASRRCQIGDKSPTRDNSKPWKTVSECACKNSSSSVSPRRTNQTVHSHSVDHINQQHRTKYNCPPDSNTYARASRHEISNTRKSVSNRQGRCASDHHNAADPRRSAPRSNLRTTARTASIRPTRCCRCAREPRLVDIITVNGRAKDAHDDGSASDATEDDYRTCRTSLAASELVSDDDDGDGVTSSSCRSDDGYTTDISADCFQRRRQSILRQVGSS